MRVLTIGRSQENDIVINDAKVSRIHLQLVISDDGTYSVVDLNSANGTYVNGERISGEVKLKQNDEIRIGDTNIPWLDYIGTNPAITQPVEKKKRTTLYVCIIAASILLVVGVGWAIYHYYETQRLEIVRELELKADEARAKEEEDKRKTEIQQLKDKVNQEEIAGLRSDREKSLELAKSNENKAKAANEARVAAENAKNKAEQAKAKAEDEAKRAKAAAQKAENDAKSKIQAIAKQKEEEVNSANNERDEANKKAELTEQFYNLYISLNKREAEQACKNLTKEVTDDYKTLLKTLFDKANNIDKQKIINAIKDVNQKKSIVEQNNKVADSTLQDQKKEIIDSVEVVNHQ